MRLPAVRILNRELTPARGQDVVKFEAFPISAGDRVTITFESTNSPWRQGVFVGTEGLLSIDGVDAPKFTLWHDSAPPSVIIEVKATDGALRLYNIWHSGRFPGHESQKFTSGCLVEEVGTDRVYRCNDIGLDPAFDKLVFRVSVQRVTAAET